MKIHEFSKGDRVFYTLFRSVHRRGTICEVSGSMGPSQRRYCRIDWDATRLAKTMWIASNLLSHIPALEQLANCVE